MILLVDNIVFYLLFVLNFMNKVNLPIAFILFNPHVSVVSVLFCILTILCLFTSNIYFECVK